jgi:hypothetical protein
VLVETFRVDGNAILGTILCMGFPIRTCVICGDEFELRPDKPGFANRCPICTEEEASETKEQPGSDVDPRAEREMNEARRKAIRDLLYRKDS